MRTDTVRLYRPDGKFHCWISEREAHVLLQADEVRILENGIIIDHRPPPDSRIVEVCEHAAKDPARLPCRYPCEICGFNRAVELAHVIPARLGAEAKDENLLILCPNHHTLFDRDQLTWFELSKIWPKVRAALLARMRDRRLDAWRERLSRRYGVTFSLSTVKVLDIYSSL
jgi:hypothetical protein